MSELAAPERRPEAASAHAGSGEHEAEAPDDRHYRMRDGRVIELPDDMTAAEARQLEADALKAQQKLGRGPPPQPVPDVHVPAEKQPGKPAKAAAGPARGQRKGGPGGPRTAGLKATLKVTGGKVAQYLVAKATPVLARGAAALGRLSRNEQTHDGAAAKVAQAEKAVVVPDSEGASRASTAQVGAVHAKPAPPVDPAAGQRRLQESLRENVPQRIEDVDNFQRDRKAQHMGADVLQVVQGDKNAVVGTFAELGHTPPPVPPEHPPEALPPPEVAPGTPPLNLGAGAVAPLLPEHTDTRQYTNEADARLKEEGVTQEQLDMVDSGDLASANKEKKALAVAAKSEPLAVQKLAQQQTGQVAAELQQEEKKERHALSNHRQQGLAGAAGKQKAAKSALEKKRDEVAARINGIYKAAQDKVKTRLDLLETQAMQRFDDGNAAASKAFESNVNRELEAFKDDRYSGWFGWARKAKDWLLGMDELPQVQAIFDRNRARFVTSIDRLVAEIGAENKRVIQECRDELAKARTEIQAYVDSLGPSLKDIGQKTAGEVNSQLDEMDGFIRKKEAALQQKLADKQQAAIKAIDEKIEKMKESMAGALSKLGKLLLWAAKKFFTWALSKFGYSLAEIEGIISRGAAVLKAIFTQPIQFVKNLVRAAIDGFQNFGKNFLDHLQDALFEWLTGSLTGLVLPKTWNLQGVVDVALQMIGISYANLRRVMVEVMGEKVVVGLETGFALVKTLVTEGPMAAWEQLKDMATDLQDAFIAAVKDFIKWKIVEEAIKWVVSLFVPGAGIVKAIIGIYDTVVFFIQKAKQIAQMVGNFLGSIGEIAAGNVAAAAAAMENGLARGLALVISFLAKLLHLDGITAKIRDAIQKIRGKVDAALLKVVQWIAGKAKALIARVTGGVKAGVQAVVQWWKKKTRFQAGGEDHELSFRGDAEQAEPWVASTPKKVAAFVAAEELKQPAPPVKAALTTIQGLLRKLDAEKRKKAPDQKAINAHFDAIALALPPVLAAQGQQPAATLVLLDPVQQGFGKRARVVNLSRIGVEHPPTVNTIPAWEALRKRVNRAGGTSTYYVRGHLVNGTFGGPGDDWRNLTPITQAANNRSIASMLHAFESPVRDAVKAQGTADIIVTAAYKAPSRNVSAARLRKDAQDYPAPSKSLLLKGRSAAEREAIAEIIEAEATLPAQIIAKALLRKPDKSLKTMDATTDNVVDTELTHYFHADHVPAGGAQARTVINLNTADTALLITLTGVNRSTAERIQKRRGQLTRQRFADRDDFVAQYDPADPGKGVALWHAMSSTASVKLEF